MVLAQDLRDAVLQAAFCGKLTKQSPTDTDVQKTLDIIKTEKIGLIEKKKGKEDVKFPEIEEKEKNFKTPENWLWVRIGDVGVYKKGPFGSALTKSIFVPKSNDAIKVYEQKNAIQKDSSLGSYYISKRYYEEKMKSFTVEAGDIIVSCAGTIGETYVMPDNIELGILNQALMRMSIVDSMNIDYFLYYFNHIVKTEAQKASKGSAIKNIPPFHIFKKMPMPFPPIEEQQRIVDKVSELMEKIDDYEKVEKELESLKSKFPTDVRDAVLQAAIQGKLTKRLESDGSVKEMLKAIKEEKEQDIKKNKTKNRKELFFSDENIIPFDIPNNWRWVQLGEIASLKMGKTPPRAELEYWGSDLPWVSIADMVENGYIDKTKEGISYRAYKEKFGNEIAKKGTLIMSFKLTVGRVSILNMDAAHNEAIVSIVPYYDTHNKIRNYLFKTLGFLARYGKTKNAIKGSTLNFKSLNSLLIPFPPIEEQERIVEQLERLLPLCETL
ncbi:MAG: hypothetical protein HFG41_07350 [Coprococcus sp.]|nr:hypothetical protein [Coprococcus sp.]